ncbi:SsrA-binding protein SmpB [Defluviicoccus vanus]|uniref:SsrA-binding protein n=1 Tax=Defluviicoccus vanus TaxID=111831 RepID=A0A7H1N0G7_9PROT|nr:SsrA-binding protein SmpB [Defluviicoccus vanus]QNT69203.1 SsrA-binding protein SmpB [Defluviicoccus vanus]
MGNKGGTKEAEESRQYIVRNRRARHDYSIDEVYEAGIMLYGSELKSLRLRRASLAEAYAHDKGGELFLVNAHISPYDAAKTFGHEPLRPRKILMHAREILKLIGAVRRKGMTLVPLSLYFNRRGRVKLELALAKGRTKGDMREAIKERDWNREKQRMLRG